IADAATIRSSEMFRVFPKADSIMEIPVKTRGKLHRILAEHSENRFYRRPIYFNTDNLSAWFRGSELPRSIVEDIARLAYPTPSGHGFFFADVALALRRSPSGPAEKVLFQSLLRRHGLV